MNRIIKIGMDVHTTNYTLCIFEPSFEHDGTVHCITQVKPEVKNILRVIETFKNKHPEESFKITCGYEAGCLGYSLYHDLKAKGIECVILAPTTMKVEKGGRKIKNDYRDARMIAECLAYGGYSAVHVPTQLDNSVKEYIRMRDDVQSNLKSIKQQIIGFMTRNGKSYDGKSYWTQKHLDWIRQTTFHDPLLRVEELSTKEEYVEKVKQLQCLIGIKTHTALSLIVETSDFKRFRKGDMYAAYLGLIPGEDSSAEHENRLGITKAGNRHLRRLLVEAAQGYTRGQIGFKSKALKERQEKCDHEVVAYADRANERLRRKYYRMIGRGKKYNVAKTAIARELACFVWGIMTDHIELQ